MKRKLMLLVMCLILVGCGSVQRGCANIEGSSRFDAPSPWFEKEIAAGKFVEQRLGLSTLETCIDGVKYLQFLSGATVKYMPDGRIATCQ
jgi:hypothetical protein